MAGERALPGLGIFGFWTPGSNGWGTQHSEGLRMLSVLTQPRCKSFVAAVPGSPANGDIHVLTSAPNANAIAVRDNGAWVYLTPSEGFVIYNEAANAYYRFTGAAWRILTPTPAGVGDAGKAVIVAADGESFELGAGGGGGGGAVAVEDEGAEITAAAARLNFVGDGVTVTDAGSGEVQISVPGGALSSVVWRGALLGRTSAVSLTTLGTWTPFPFDAELQDAGGFVDITTNPTRITIPSGVTKVKFSGFVRGDGGDPAESDQFSLRKNGTTILGVGSGGFSAEIPPATGGYNNSGSAFVSGVLDVAAGDYFELVYFVSATADVAAHFQCEVVEGAMLGGLAVAGANNVYARVEASGNYALGAGSTTTLTWGRVVEDAAGLWNAGTNNFVIPAALDGKVVYLVSATQHTADGTGSVEMFIERSTDGGTTWTRLVQSANGAIDHFGITTASAITRVATGHRFRVRQFTSAAKSIIDAPQTFFSIAALDTASSGLSRSVRTVTGSASLVITDENATVVTNAATANVLTVPADASVAFANGCEIDVIQKGAGTTTITAAAGVTIRGVSEGSAAMSGQWAHATLRKIAANEWALNGEHGAVS